MTYLNLSLNLHLVLNFIIIYSMPAYLSEPSFNLLILESFFFITKCLDISTNDLEYSNPLMFQHLLQLISHMLTK